MKDIKDYLHLYLGCQVQFEFTTIVKRIELREGKMISINQNGMAYELDVITDNGASHSVLLRSVKPILRPLSSMTDGEATLLGKYDLDELESFIYDMEGCNQYSPKDLLFLLSKHFDFFGLIEDGLAIDATKVNQPVQ